MMLLKTFVMGEHIPFQPCAGMNKVTMWCTLDP